VEHHADYITRQDFLELKGILKNVENGVTMIRRQGIAARAPGKPGVGCVPW
jgi:hypothetical protein